MISKSFQVRLGDFYEVRGIITQGVDQGQIDIINSNGRVWTKTFSVKYMASNDEFKDIVDNQGVIKVFDGNYDIKFRVKIKNKIIKSYLSIISTLWKSQVVNMFPQVLITTALRVYPKLTKNGRAGLRMELIGCKSDCVKSLGVCSNNIQALVYNFLVFDVW